MFEIKRLCALALATLLLGFWGVAGAEMAPLPTVKSLDLPRFLDKWHEIALIPNRFQRKCVRDTEAEYAAGGAAELLVRNRCVAADGSVEVAIGAARRVNPGDPTRLQVRFAPSWLAWLPLVWGDYWVIGLADDYRYAVLGEPSRSFLWILARDTAFCSADRVAIDALLLSVGYDPQRLVSSPQSGGVR